VARTAARIAPAAGVRFPTETGNGRPAVIATLAIALGYVLGSLPWGYWLPRVLRGVDIRSVGSGNTGAANVWRTFGFRLGLAVALLDVAKGLAATLVGVWLGGDLVGVAAGVAALVGHWRPLFLRLARGGKVVATTGGVALALAPLAGIAAGGVWVLVFLATRYSSVASLAGAVALPPFAFLLGASWPAVGFTIGAAVAIVVLHRANISRLVHGQENRFAFSRRPRLPGRLAGTRPAPRDYATPRPMPGSGRDT
jgi:glycerol-3-phosphate acyltransferase PlsY